MKTKLYSLTNFALFFLLGSMIVLSSCQKEPDLIGMGLQSDNEKLGLGFSDSTTIIAYSVFDDSLRTDNYSASLFGTYNDPIFGTTTASIFTQYRLSSLSPNFPIAASLDSLILYLPYSGSYQADNKLASISPLQLKVYEVADKMYIDSIYYSDRMLNVKTAEIGNLAFTPKPNDSSIIDGVKSAPVLKIKLSDTPDGIALGKALLAAPSADLADNDKFTALFKGLFIKAFPLNTTMANKGSILYFNLLSSLANLRIYYKLAPSDTISTQFNFAINGNCAKFTNFNHYNYNGSNSTLTANSDFRNQLGVNVPANINLGQQKLFLQSMGGVKVNFKFPYLRDLIKNQKVVVNEAVLVIKNDDTDNKNAPPTLLTILKKLASGKTEFLPDIFEGSAFFDGIYNTTTHEYRIRMTRYFQNMLNTTTEDFGLVMLIDSRRTTANRFVFTGTDKTLANRMKLELKYTIIK